MWAIRCYDDVGVCNAIHVATCSGADSTKLSKVECVHTLKGLALLRTIHLGEFMLPGSRCLRSTLAAAPVLFAHAVVTVAKQSRFSAPCSWLGNLGRVPCCMVVA